MRPLVSLYLSALFATTIANAQPTPADPSTGFYVAKNGSDASDGSLAHPFATIAKAKEAVKALKEKKGLPKGGLSVWIRNGAYELTEGLVFDRNDGGEPGKPVVYRAYQGERPLLSVNRKIAPDKWRPLAKDALKRVHPNVVANKLLELDLKPLSLKNASSFSPKKQFTQEWFIVGLFADRRRQPLSQWPDPEENIRGKNDAGYVTCNGSKDAATFYFGPGGKPEDKDSTDETALDGTNRAGRWAAALAQGHEIWLKGLWVTPWEPRTIQMASIDPAAKTISLAEPPNRGMGSKYSAAADDKASFRAGNGRENWFALNLLEEIDKPGEWALDTKDNKIYYYPPAPIASLETTIADQNAPIVSAKSVADLQFIGLGFEGGLGNGLSFLDCKDIVVAGCEVANTGGTGIEVVGCSGVSVHSNDIAHTGGYGIYLKNIGNRATLESGNAEVVNNHVHHIGEVVFRQAIALDVCVGVHIAHNLLHDINKGCISLYDVNNCLVEFNEIHNIALKEYDTGVFYNYGGWSTYGNLFRYNFSHHTRKANGFYSDDGDSGDKYAYNIVQGCVNGVVFGGGHDNLAQNNLFVATKTQFVDDRGIARNYRLGTAYEKKLAVFKPNEGIWKAYGEKLKADNQLTTNLWSDIFNPQWMPEYPNGCRITDNVAVASGKFRKPKNGSVTVENNLEIPTIQEAAFRDYAAMDLRTNDPRILSKFPDLNEIFPRIGLEKGPYRSALPTRAETGGLAERGGVADMKNEDQYIDQIKPVKKN